MSVSYIYEGNYAVCTFQMTPAPQKLVASRINPRPISDSEVLHLNEKGEIITTPLPPYNINVTTFHQDDKILLNIRDKNAEITFGCKLPTQLATTFLAFGAGLFVSLLLLSNPIGWIAMGVGMAIAIGCIAAGIIYTAEAITHTCTAPMQSGMWMLPHSSVEFDGYPAITQAAMLTCGNGGIVKPFLTLALAQQAGNSIRWKNITEVGINGVISLFAGIFTATGFFAAFAPTAEAVVILGTPFTVSAVVWETSTLVGGSLIGTPAMMWFLSLQKDYMRGNEDLADNKSYQNMNFAEGNSVFSPVDDPSDLSNPFDLNHFYQIVNGSENVNFSKDPVLQSQLDQLKGLSKSELHWSRNSITQEIRLLMKAGGYPEIQAAMMNHPDYNDNRMNKSMLKEANKANQGTKRQAVKIDVAKNKLESAKKFSAGMLYFFPFIANAFSENVRRDIAEAAEMDIEAATGDKGSTVLADRPLG